MRMTTRAAGIALAAAAGALMFGSPAQAGTGWDNSAQAAPGQACNTDATGFIGGQAPIISPELVAGPCGNGAVQGSGSGV